MGHSGAGNQDEGFFYEWRVFFEVETEKSDGTMSRPL